MTNLLIYRFILVNTLFFALTAAVWWNGYLEPVFRTDLSYLTFAIAALFALGWLGTAKEVVIASRQLNVAKSGPQPARETDRDKDLAKVEWLASVSEWLVGLGLVGTVIGFIIALSSVDQSALLQTSGAQSAVATLMAGMRTALNTTVLGASLALWHEVNQRMLRTALAVYWADRLAAVPQGQG
ncbi:MAG TPA: MotA/TolQ/ExbB proton channel family protein [Aestuariivirgaceae bacterium]|nr:MotA/TolQ/ExbB proton channel family protein [Aestuariivirgaceae bacterium]